MVLQIKYLSLYIFCISYLVSRISPEIQDTLVKFFRLIKEVVCHCEGGTQYYLSATLAMTDLTIYGYFH